MPIGQCITLQEAYRISSAELEQITFWHTPFRNQLTEVRLIVEHFGTTENRPMHNQGSAHHAVAGPLA